jgi:photosystem II stability/assembly factor-like uncharacterized protein
MKAFQCVYCTALLVGIVNGSVEASSLPFCKNHYILDYPCGVLAGTPPPTIELPPVPIGVKHWSAIGPDGANVVTLMIDPEAPAIAFAGTIGSGILKTTNGAASWTTANSGLPTSNVLALAIDPAAPSILYAGTDAGVFKSTDGGQTWFAANGGLGAAPTVVNALAIDAESPSTLYAGTSGGVFKTTNGATSWTSINAGLSGLAARVITVDPTSASTVYVGVDDIVGDSNYGAFKSTDGGTTWTKIYSVPPDGEGGAPPIMALVVDPLRPSRVYLLVAFNRVLTSQDGGATWSDIAAPAHDVWSLAIDPASSGTIYVGTYLGLVFRTTDGGAHWASAPDGPQASGVNVIAISGSAPATLYAGTRNGVFRSSDSAQTWTHPALGVRKLGVYPVAVVPTAPSTIYTAVGGVLMKTTDGGAQWIESNAGLSAELSVDRLAIDPVSPSIVYAVQTSGHTVIYKSTDGGAHWAPPSNMVFGPSALAAIEIARSEPSILFIGVNWRGVLKSTDSGASWSAANIGLTAVGPYVTALAVDPTTANTVYAATSPTGQPYTPGKIFKSIDGAAHWRQIPIGLPTNTAITSLVVDRVAPSTLYAGYADYADPGQGGVLKSTDGGETWMAASQGLPTAWVVKLVAGTGSPSQLYAASRFGVFTSIDAATSWTPISAGLSTVELWDLAIDGAGSVLRAATIAGLFEYPLSDALPSVAVAVIEYYHAGFGDYFITGYPDEIAKLDSGAIDGWARTGLQFNAFGANATGTSPVCRFYTAAFAPKRSHFFTPFAPECASVESSADWLLESRAAFYIAIPASDGSCAAGTTPVYRLYNNGHGGAPQHRYTTDVATRAHIIGQGWIPEGIGPDGVEMCAPH